MANPKAWLVVLLIDAHGPVYLGEIDRGARQGVRRLESATRFTAIGAKRIAAGYGNVDSRTGASVMSESEAAARESIATFRAQARHAQVARKAEAKT